MPLTCPACRKVYEGGAGPAACARCGTELVSLVAVRQAAVALRQRAVRALAARDWRTALTQAQFSWDLHHSLVAARVACLAAAGLGCVQELASWRVRASAPLEADK